MDLHDSSVFVSVLLERVRSWVCFGMMAVGLACRESQPRQSNNPQTRIMDCEANTSQYYCCGSQNSPLYPFLCTVNMTPAVQLSSNDRKSALDLGY